MPINFNSLQYNYDLSDVKFDENNNTLSLFDAVKELCYRKRITLAELARRLDKTQSSLTQSLKHNRLTLRSMVRLADYFNVDLNELIAIKYNLTKESYHDK